jgi:hypothetical protein
MALGINDFDAGKSITQALEEVGPENLDSGPNPSSVPLNRFACIKIITSCAI